jgi:hypothetical protein
MLIAIVVGALIVMETSLSPTVLCGGQSGDRVTHMHEVMILQGIP